MKEKLQTIIDEFNEDELKQKGIFGISQYGGGPDESFIRANKEGLELFALQLLKSAIKMDNGVSDPENNIIPFDYDEDWVDESSDTFIQYVEPIADKQQFIPKAASSDKLRPFGCGLGAIILIISVLLGLVAVFNWIF